jgi:hypothetical protein
VRPPGADFSLRPLIWVAAASLCAAVQAQVATFDQQGPVSADEGHTTLSWAPSGSGPSADSPPQYRLEESDSRSFEQAKVRYEGPDRASFIAGLPDGDTWFRVQAIDAQGNPGPWSVPIRVAVRYPDRTRVVPLLLLGATVFVLTVGAVLVGHRRHHASLTTSDPGDA